MSREPGGEALMVVCHCKAVSDRAIRKAVRDGACTRNAVARECLSGGVCGGCAPVIDEIISHERRREERAADIPPLAELATSG